MRNSSGVCFLILLFCSLTSAVALGPTLLSRNKAVNSPASANFLRRAYHASVVLGDYLYIDGGEFSQLVDGVPDDEFSTHSRPNNFTLSIDLTLSWNNATVAINPVPKGLAPVLNYETLWKTPDGKSCFVCAGETSLLIAGEPPLELWKFDIDDLGGGTWSAVSSNDTLFPNLLRQSTGCGIANGDTGFYTGGYTSGKTDITTAGQGNLGQAGIVSFNMTSGAWSNDSTIGLNDFGTLQNSIAVTLPAIGLGRSLIIILGGVDIGPPASETDFYNRQISLGNITIYDPYIGVWFSQTATGTIPGPRGAFCAISIPGDNGTYEIFIYGEEEGSTQEPYDEVYVLSIPGFVWFKADYPSQSPRVWHTCEIVGRRQLVTIGGLDHPAYNYSIPDMWNLNDTFSQGLGIFDMTDMVWKDSYDANAYDYQSPEVVKDWYAAGNQNSVKWQSKQVARMFIPDDAVSVSPTPAYVVTSTSLSNSTSSSTLDLSDKIALGTSISIGVPGLAAAVMGVYLTWMHYKKKAKNEKAYQEKGSSSSASAEISTGPNVSSDPGPIESLPSNKNAQPMNTRSLTNETNAETTVRSFHFRSNGKAGTTQAETSTAHMVANNYGLKKRSGSI